jgi:uncharacterized protein (TIGR02147 family)
MMQSSVDVFSFSDHRSYLKSVLAAEKARHPGFKLQTLAERAGFRSPSTISMILNGRRRLTPAAAEKIAEALALQGRRRKFFMALVRLGAARNEDDRTLAREAIYELQGTFKQTLLDLRQYRFLSHWYYPVLYVMVGMKRVRWNPEWLAAKIGRGVSIEQIKVAIADMMGLNLIKHEGGVFAKGAIALNTADDIKGTAIFRYHRQMADLAAQSLELPFDEREFNGVTIALPKEQLKVVKNKIRAFRAELNEYLSRYEADGERIYQINFQIFPLTQDLNETEHKKEET